MGQRDKTTAMPDGAGSVVTEPYSMVREYIQGAILPPDTPFDSYHYDYYKDIEESGNPARMIARDQTIWDTTLMLRFGGDVPRIYRAESITGGPDAHELAIDQDHRLPSKIGDHEVFFRTVKDLKWSAGSELMNHCVVGPNLEEAGRRQLRVLKSFPECNLIDPFRKEGAVTLSRVNSNMSMGRSPEEEDFMGGWYIMIDACKGLIFNYDIPFSRNSNWEEWRGELNALGFLNGITKDKGEFTFYLENGERASSALRLESQVRYLLYALEHDFNAREAATAVAWKLEADRRLRDPDYNAASIRPLDYKGISEQKRWEYFSGDSAAKEILERIDYLRSVAEPLLLTHFIGHMDENHIAPLDERYHDARAGLAKKKPLLQSRNELNPDQKIPLIRPLEKKLAEAGLEPDDWIKQAIEDNGDLRWARQSPAADLPFSMAGVADGQITFPFQEQIQMDGGNGFDVSSFGPQIFNDDVYSLVASENERLLLQRALGAALVNLPPAAHSGWVYVSADFETNERAINLAKDKGVLNVQDLPGSMKNWADFETKIYLPAIWACDDLVSQRSDGKTPVISTLDIRAMKELYRDLDHPTAKPKMPTEASDEMRLAMEMAIIDFMAVELVMGDPAWARSPRQVQKMVRATLVQTGQTKRGGLHPTNLEVKDHEGRPISFHDRFTQIYCCLTDDLEANGIPARDHALACIRLMHLYEKMIDHTYNAGQIKTGRSPESLYHGFFTAQRKGMDELYAEAKDFLRQPNIMRHLDETDLKDLPEEWREYWKRAQGAQQLGMQEKRPGTIWAIPQKRL